MGRPSDVLPTGTEIAGWPVTQVGAVLPTIFGLWQPLVARIRAADGAPDILQAVLHTVTALVRGAPDFLLPKFNGELLPALSALFRRYQQSDPLTASVPTLVLALVTLVVGARGSASRRRAASLT